MNQVLVVIVKVYQYLLSPFLGNHCRYHPSCSSYAIEALQTHGSMRGLWMALKRVSRCHPWHEGGYDPVPEPKQKNTHG